MARLFHSSTMDSFLLDSLLPYFTPTLRLVFLEKTCLSSAKHGALQILSETHFSLPQATV